MPLPNTYLDFTYGPARHRLSIACSVDEFQDQEDVEASFITVLEPPKDLFKLGSIELKTIRVRSAIAMPGATWAIGRYGEVLCIKGAAIDEDQLPDAGVRSKRHLGPPKLIRQIGEALYVCGFAGQVYTQAGGRWVHMDDGLCEPEGHGGSIQLEGMHGTGSSNIYVCGSGGLLAHWDGKAWTKIPLLTDKWLAGVRCLGDKDVIAVGNDGTVVRGDGTRWKVEQLPGYEKTHLADVEVFEGRLWIAAQNQLLVSSGTGWEVVKHGLDPAKTSFYRLTTGDGRLWCMGAKRISSFDGKAWTSHVDSNNG